MGNKVVGLISLIIVLSLATLVAGAGRAEPVPAGWWRLDGNAEDSSGNDNHGTVLGNPPWVAGKYGETLDLDGVDDYVDCGNGPSLNITGELTVSAWIYPTGPGAGNYGRILDKSSGTGAADPGYKFYLRGAENYVVTLSVGGGSQNTSARLVLNSWNYFVFVATGTQWRALLNDTWQEWNNTGRPNSVTAPLFIGNSSSGARYFDGMLDDVRIYNVALTDEEIQEVMKGPRPPGQAYKPIPAEGEVDVPRDVTLRWTPAKEVAASNGHIVYLSQNFQDVNDGIGGVRQSDASYDTGQLEFGTTYYWRVDEVSASGGTIPKGTVWSFTVEPYAYPIDNVAATASSAQDQMGPQNTVNGSGLDAEDGHGTVPEQMWLSDGTLPNWVQYEFDQVYKLDELWVWNSNQLIEGIVGFGAKDATIEYSQDGSTWTALAGVPEFGRGPGTEGYIHNTAVSCGGVLARYVKLTINATWGATPLGGLSEVRFFSVPVRAREPVPADAAAGLALSTVLSWRPGREAASHQVYLSKDEGAVVNGTVPATTVAAHSFAPADLEFGATYYWRVDEVNDARAPAVHAGPIWSFHTQEYAVVDDFESYTDDEGSRIYEAWVDGYGTTTNGSQVGYVEGPFAEQTVVHGDRQSMPLFFNNAAGAAFSEAELTLSPAQDWTAGGAQTLALWFYGDPNSTGAQLYAKVNGAKVVYDGDAADLQAAGWRPWNIPLAAFGGNLQKVATLALGIDGSGAAGRFFFDDIRLYPRERQLVTPVEPNTTGLVAYYKLDQDATDSSASKNHGTVVGNPSWVAGKVGGAVQLDGRNDYLDCGNPPSLNITGPITIAAWMHPVGPGGGNYGRLLDKSSGTGSMDPGYKIYHRAAENYIVTLSAGGGDRRSGSSLVLNSWNFFGFVATGTQWRLCLNGTWQEWEETHLPTLVDNPLYIGNSSTGDRHFDGMLDEVRIYNRALTAGEIAWLAGRTKPFDLPF